MSFPVPELIMTTVIEDRLDYLAKHPDHLHWMLSPFAVNTKIARLVDARYIAQCVEYVQSNRPIVKPAYDLDKLKMPSIVVSSYQGESQLFLGDTGYDHMAERYEPLSLMTLDALKFVGNTVVLSANQGALETIWPSLYFKSGQFHSKITQVIDKDKEVWLALSDEIPSGTPLRGCTVDTSKDEKWYVVNSSIDNVKVSIILTTAGDNSVHRLMATVLRYCIKAGRMLMESSGMQVATVSQRPVQLVDSEQLIWQTEFTVDAKVTDHWIADEGGLVTAPMIVEITPDNQKEDDWS